MTVWEQMDDKVSRCFTVCLNKLVKKSWGWFQTCGCKGVNRLTTCPLSCQCKLAMTVSKREQEYPDKHL